MLRKELCVHAGNFLTKDPGVRQRPCAKGVNGGTITRFVHCNSCTMYEPKHADACCTECRELPPEKRCGQPIKTVGGPES